MREIGRAAFRVRDRTDPNRRRPGGGPGDVFVKSRRLPADPGPGRPRPDVDDRARSRFRHVACWCQGHDARDGRRRPGWRAGPAAVRARHRVEAVRAARRPATCSASRTTTASQVRYVNEGTATQRRGGCGRGAAPSPSRRSPWRRSSEPIKKIATVLPISDELLEDAPSIQCYLNGRLTLFVKHRGGAAAAPRERHERADRPVQPAGRPGDQPVHEARRGRQRDGAGAGAGEHGRVGVPAARHDHHAPDELAHTRLLRDGTGGTAGNFLGGGPFTGAYGNGGATGLFGQTLWNTRVVLSTVVGSGTALVGNFGQGAHIWRRGGVSRRGDKQPRRLLREEPDDAQGRGEIGARLVQAGRVHGGERPGIGPHKTPVPLTGAPARACGAAGSPLTAAPPLEPNQGGTQMEFTETRAGDPRQRMAARPRGQGPGARGLGAARRASGSAEAGWLERRTVDATGDTCWFWTRAGRGGARHERATPRPTRRT